MAHTACQVVAFPSRPVSSLIAPREHGAWGLLFVPLITGGASGLLAGGNWPPLAAFATAAFALFWLRTPMEAWMGAGLVRPQTQRERQAVAVTILTLSALAVLALGALFWNDCTTLRAMCMVIGEPPRHTSPTASSNSLLEVRLSR